MNSNAMTGPDHGKPGTTGSSKAWAAGLCTILARSGAGPLMRAVWVLSKQRDEGGVDAEPQSGR